MVVKGKVPFGRRLDGKEWNKEFLSRDEIIARLDTGKYTGIGAYWDDSYISLDFDGHSTFDKALEINNGQELETARTWSSGKPGREGRFYRVPEEYIGKLQSKKIPTGVIGDDGKAEQLEIRYHCQSVLPGSIHPETNKPYYRVNDIVLVGVEKVLAAL